MKIQVSIYREIYKQIMMHPQNGLIAITKNVLTWKLPIVYREKKPSYRIVSFKKKGRVN